MLLITNFKDVHHRPRLKNKWPWQSWCFWCIVALTQLRVPPDLFLKFIGGNGRIWLEKQTSSVRKANTTCMIFSKTKSCHPWRSAQTAHYKAVVIDICNESATVTMFIVISVVGGFISISYLHTKGNLALFTRYPIPYSDVLLLVTDLPATLDEIKKIVYHQLSPMVTGIHLIFHSYKNKCNISITFSFIDELHSH